MQNATTTILAFDVGKRRIGVAIADSIARLARPLKTISNSKQVIETLQTLIAEQTAESVVVGVPRGLEGQDTQQTVETKAFIDGLRGKLTIPVYEQDEAVTSVQAEAELATRQPAYNKGDIDALAATYILEDFLRTGTEQHHGQV